MIETKLDEDSGREKDARTVLLSDDRTDRAHLLGDNE